MKKLLLILPLLMFTACSSSTEKALVGKWKIDGRDAMMEFHEDGTGRTYGGQAQNRTWEYTFIGKDEVEVEGSGTTERLKVSVSGDELTMEASNGNLLKAERVGKSKANPLNPKNWFD